MTKKRDRKCPIVDKVQIICPLCNGIVTIPMCQAVNGEKIICPNCGKEFLFRPEMT
jgi:RNA polymerase subunit RPABC4/transcription elongation factor Spt4